MIKTEQSRRNFLQAVGVGAACLAGTNRCLAQVGSAEELVAMLAEDPGAIEPLIAAYRSGDLEQIATLTQLEDARTQELLLDSRNRRWVHKLTPALKRGGVFAAVGVGHAPGAQGLLQLLSKRGYTLRQYGA